MELKSETKRAVWVSMLLAVTLWLWIAFHISTFDLDESLYRRVAEEMKRSGDPWHLSWDQKPLYHKPPIYYWWIALVSMVVDGIQAPVSALASRLSSVLIGIGILFSLPFWSRPYFLLSTFALLTVPAVIFDPFQSLALLPAILIPHRWFKEERNPFKSEIALVILSISAATAIKGLNGFVLPLAAILIQAVLAGRHRDLKGLIKLIAPISFGSLILSTLYYVWLDQKLGRPFTDEFFWVHHLGRSQAPMEAHSGSAFYYVWVVLLGSGALFPFLVSHLSERARSWKETGYPLTFSLVFLIFFSFSATKLPHYLWPIWPALAIAIGDRSPTLERNAMNRIKLALSFLPLFIFTAVAVFLALSPIALLHEVLTSPAFISMFPRDYSFPALSRACFAIAALVGAVLVVQRKSWIQKPAALASATAVMLLFLVGGATPIIQDRIHAPAEQIAAQLKAMDVPAGTCVRYSGPHSPTLSLALGNEILHNRCEPSEMAVLIAPEWKLQECKERGMQILGQKGYLYLCVDPAKTSAWKTNAPKDEIKTLPGQDQIAGTEDDIVIRNAPSAQIENVDEILVTQLAGFDKTPNTLDDVVVGQYAGPDQILGTADDVPATPRRANKPVPIAIEKKIRVQHLGLQKSKQPATFNFISASDRTQSVEIRMAGADQKLMSPDDQIVIQSPGPDQQWGTQDDALIDQFVGQDQIAGTEDDEIRLTPVGPNGTFEESIEALPMTAKAKGAARPSVKTKNKIQHLGLNAEAAAQTFSFVGADGIDKTADDVLITMAPKVKPKGSASSSGAQTSSRALIQYAGPDATLGTEDDVIETRYVGPDKIAGTADDEIRWTQAGPDLVAGTADDIQVDESKFIAPAQAEATPTAQPRAATSPAASMISFPKPAATPMARKTIRKVSTPKLSADSPKKVIEATFERNSKIVEAQVVEMDYCEAYLCDEEFQSARVIDNIETLLIEFPTKEFRAKQVKLLEQSLAKAIEYKKNWKKHTPEYEIGLMSQEQVDEAMNPLISRLRGLIQKAKKPE